MQNCLHKIILVTIIIVFSVSVKINAQTCEWRLANPTFSAVDPDGAGPATGSVTFTLQIHTTSGSIPNVTGISTGWSWQSSNANVANRISLWRQLRRSTRQYHNVTGFCWLYL